MLSALAHGPADHATIRDRSRVASGAISRYLDVLDRLGLVSPPFPVTDPERRSHKRQYVLNDGFARAWFRYVFPFQSDLEAGLDASVIIEHEIRPTLASHVALTSEDVAREWVRRRRIGNATRVGAWWGNATNALRRSKVRSTEEIDIVGLCGKEATVIGEVRWRNKPMDGNILKEIAEFKVPALVEAGVTVDQPIIVLISRATRRAVTLVTRWPSRRTAGR